MERRNIIIIAAAVVLGLIAVYLANSYFGAREAQQERVAEQQKLVNVAVATQDLAFGSVLTPETVRMVSWPANSVPPGAFRDMSRFAGQDVAIRPIARGEPILNSRISSRAVLSENIPENMRAVTVPVDDVTGVAGFVTPGDAVDIYLTRSVPVEGADADDKMVTVVLENVQVLAIDRRSSETETEPQELKMATMLVDPASAQKLVLAKDIGTLSLALRNVEDRMMGANPIVTTAQLGGRPPRRRSGGTGGTSSSAATTTPAQARYVPAAAGPATTAAAAAPVLTGPTMTVYRGTQGERQEVQNGI